MVLEASGPDQIKFLDAILTGTISLDYTVAKQATKLLEKMAKVKTIEKWFSRPRTSDFIYVQDGGSEGKETFHLSPKGSHIKYENVPEDWK